MMMAVILLRGHIAAHHSPWTAAWRAVIRENPFEQAAVYSDPDRGDASKVMLETKFDRVAQITGPAKS